MKKVGILTMIMYVGVKPLVFYVFVVGREVGSFDEESTCSL